MLGFVSALSSTLAIIVLISSVLLVNLLGVSLKRNEKQFNLKINTANTDENIDSRVSKREKKDGFSISRYILSPNDLPPPSKSITTINTGCFYGNNFSYEVASKITALNYIILSKHFSDINVIIEKPKLEENKVNDCWVNFEERK